MTVKVWIFRGCTNQPYERTWDWWLQRNILICTGLLPLSLYYVHTHAHQCTKFPRPCASQGSSFFFILQASTDWGYSCAEETHCLLLPLAPFSITLTLIHCIVIIILAIITFFWLSLSHIAYHFSFHFFLSVLCSSLSLSASTGQGRYHPHRPGRYGRPFFLATVAKCLLIQEKMVGKS